MTYETILAVFEGGVAGPSYGGVVYSMLAVSEGVCQLSFLHTLMLLNTK
jgi:hypothetical protein